MEHKKVYYYNPKYPEYGIEELLVDDIAWITHTMTGAYKYIHCIYSKFNIETGAEEDFTQAYHTYNPYTEDDDMFVYDLPGNRERILSFNREKLVEWWQEDVKTQYNIMKKRLEDLEKCLNQK